MQALAGLADERRQPALDIEMHVFGIERPGELAAANLAADAREAALDGAQIRFADNAGAGEHARVRQRPGDILLGEPPVEVDGGGKALYALGDRRPEAAGPRLRLNRHVRTMSFEYSLR